MAKSKKPMSPAMAEMAEMAEGCAATSADVATLERENLSPVRPINLPKVQLETILIPIQGDTELICHAWSKKAKMMMLAKQMGKPSSGREKKEPIADFIESLYVMQLGRLIRDENDTYLEARTEDNHPDVRLEGGIYAFPALALKEAMVESCTSTGKAISKVQARQAFHIQGAHHREFLFIEGSPRMREDMVRLNGSTADIRYRGGFMTWSTVAKISYNVRVLTRDQVVNLVNLSGFTNGLGEWRPQRGGNFGMFHVSATEPCEVITE